MSNEFDKLKPKPPEEIPHKPLRPPIELDKVEATESPNIKFRFPDYMRLTWTFLLGYAEKKLNPVERMKLGNFWRTAALILGTIAATIIIMLVLKI